VIAHDPFISAAHAASASVELLSIEQLLARADVITLHLALTKDTRHLINAERLALMKPTAFLINTARGGIVDTDALCQALQAKRIAGAGLDVFEGEPLRADSPLRAFENVYLSPHCAGSTADARKRSGAMAAENLVRALRGERPEGIVNPEVFTR
jgi:phosphoglycerate dehydrogenase-like enzyme